MESFVRLDGLVAPLDRSNVDTDQIIPKQYLKSIERTGFGPNLFDDWRYLDPGEPGQDHSRRRPNPEFVLNRERYQGARVLLSRNNFGCGSSREHAPWALLGYGIRCIVAVSFADIFYNNCFKNGILPVMLPAATVERLFAETASTPGYHLAIDLEARTVTTPASEVLPFTVDDGLRERLLQGLDDIGLSLRHHDQIRAFEERRKAEAPWVFQGMGAHGSHG